MIVLFPTFFQEDRIKGDPSLQTYHELVKPTKWNAYFPFIILFGNFGLPFKKSHFPEKISIQRDKIYLSIYIPSKISELFGLNGKQPKLPLWLPGIYCISLVTIQRFCWYVKTSLVAKDWSALTTESELQSETEAPASTLLATSARHNKKLKDQNNLIHIIFKNASKCDLQCSCVLWCCWVILTPLQAKSSCYLEPAGNVTKFTLTMRVINISNI